MPATSRDQNFGKEKVEGEEAIEAFGSGRRIVYRGVQTLEDKLHPVAQPKKRSLGQVILSLRLQYQRKQ